MQSGKCDCCGASDKYVSVACSALGAFSMAYCRDCAINNAEPVGIIESTIEMCDGLENVRSEYKNTIKFFKDGKYHLMSEFGVQRFILGVAVRFKDVVICLPKPNRHSNCFQYAREIGITNPTNKALDQGFYLSDGTYLDREQALAHALKVGQEFRSQPNHALFSEDLW